MVSPQTLSKLAAARNRAEQAGLADTAERIESIRKELASFKDLSILQQTYKAAWAICKVDEAKSCMAIELETPGTVVSDRRADKDSGAILAKIGLCVCTMFGGMLAVMENANHRILTAAGFIIGTLIGAGIIDNLVGSKDPKEASELVGKELEDLRKGLVCKMWKRI
jgi:hypothetical protein